MSRILIAIISSPFSPPHVILTRVGAAKSVRHYNVSAYSAERVMRLIEGRPSTVTNEVGDGSAITLGELWLA